MNNKSEIIKLPFWETIRRSFIYVLARPRLFLQVSAIWFAFLIYEVICGFPSACNFSPDNCTGSWQQNVAVIFLSIASIGIVISYCREIILKSPLNYFSKDFIKLGLVYLFYNLVFALIVAVPGVISVFVFAFIGQMLNLPEPVYLVALIFPLAIMIYFSRVLLAFPAVAVGNLQLGFKQSFKMTVGNANKIFWGQLLMMVPVLVALFALTLAYRTVPQAGMATKLVFVGLLYAFSFLNSCLKASFLAHIYQYFTFYDKEKKQQKD